MKDKRVQQNELNPQIPPETKKLLTITISGLVVISFLLLMSLGVLAYQNYQLRKSMKVILPEPYPTESQPTPTPITNNIRTFTGTVRPGLQLEGKEHCPEGFYLVANPGTYLVGQTTMLLLKEAGTQEPKMINNQAIVNNEVEIEGIYPAQEVFCEALICQCEDYILVKEITIIQ